jgi:hypothetical protein
MTPSLFSLTPAWWFASASLFVLPACGTAPCPKGTVQQGSVCKVTSGARGDAGSDAQPGSTSFGSRINSNNGAGQGAAPAIGSAMSGASAAAGSVAVTTSGAAAPASTPMIASAGTSASGNAAAAGTSSGGAAPAAVAGNNAPTAAAGTLAMPAAGTAAAGTTSLPMTGGAGAAAAGTGVPTAGTPVASAGMGGSAASGTGATPPSADWFCLDADRSCTCVIVSGVSDDMCTKPKPPCCFTLQALGNDSCQCWPQDSAECSGFKSQDPNAQRVSTCPPP